MSDSFGGLNDDIISLLRSSPRDDIHYRSVLLCLNHFLSVPVTLLYFSSDTACIFYNSCLKLLVLQS